MSGLRDKIARALFNKDQNAVSQRAAEWSWSAATASSGGETYWHKAADAVLAVIDLDKVRAEAWERGFDAGQAWESDVSSRVIPSVSRQDNPYRKAEQ